MKKSNLSKIKKETSWGPVAGWYDELLSDNDTYQAKVILPNLLRILPPKDKKIIDIACGQGFFSKIYAEGGADVLGVDISPELIAKANEFAGEKLKFEIADATNLSSTKDNSFDAAIIVLALQNIKELSGTIKEASRVLVRGGVLVLVLNHPCFRILKNSSWGYDETQKVQYRRVDAYGRPFSSEIVMNPGTKESEKPVYTVSFHRPLQEYVKALVGAGLLITGLEEWISHKKSESGPRAEAEDTARKEFPMFLTIIAKKS